jgi:hypothetical protein
MLTNRTHRPHPESLAENAINESGHIAQPSSCPANAGYPRLGRNQDVDGRDKPGHDDFSVAVFS